MKSNFELPMILSAKELQTMGFSRSMAYRLLQGDLVPVVTIGKRRFIRHSRPLHLSPYCNDIGIDGYMEFVSCNINISENT